MSEEGYVPATVRIGEKVWVKTPDTRCMTQWGRGVATGVQSENNVSVDGVSRYILDITTVRRLSINEAQPAESQDGADDEQVRRHQRERRLLYWSKDHEM